MNAWVYDGFTLYGRLLAFELDMNMMNSLKQMPVEDQL